VALAEDCGGLDDQSGGEVGDLLVLSRSCSTHLRERAWSVGSRPLARCCKPVTDAQVD
jgi:hypothetical protein